MLSTRDNELLTRVGQGTMMGTFLRRFWIPVLESADLPEPDCDPVEVRLMGEDLVAFRDSTGRIGLIEALCPTGARRCSTAATRRTACAASTTAGSGT